MSTETQAPDAKGKVVWSVPLPPEVAAHVRVCSQGGYKSPEEYAGEAIRQFMGTPETGEEDSIMSSDLMDVVNEIDYASCYIQAKLRVVLQVLEGAGNNLRGLDYEELHGLAEIVRETRQQIQERLIEPLYGAQPESAEAPTPPGTLTLDEDGVKDLIADLYRLSVAAAAGDDLSWSETQLRNAMKAIAAKVDRIVADIEGSAGMEISDAERDAIFGGVSSWGDKALRFGADAVEEEVEGDTPPSGGLELTEEEVWALGVDLWRIVYASMYPSANEMVGAAKCPDAVITLANRLCDHLFDRAGIPLGDETNNKLGAASRSFGEKAAKMGADAVDATALEEVGS